MGKTKATQSSLSGTQALSNQVGNQRPKHTHTNPFNSECPACKLVCLACNGQKWEFFIVAEDSPVQVCKCSWCNGDGTRASFDKSNHELTRQLPQRLSKTPSQTKSENATPAPPQQGGE